MNRQRPGAEFALSDVQIRYMREITDKLSRVPISFAFRDPVREDELRDYRRIVRKPMWLNLVREKIDSNHYTRLDQWQDDILLIWKNAKLYNREGFYHDCAVELENIFKDLSERIPSTETQEWVYKMERAQKKMSLVLSQQPEGL